MNNRYKYFLYLLMSIAPMVTLGQYSFQKVFGGSGDDRSLKAIELNNGNFVFVGTSTSFQKSEYITCVDNKGNELWTRYFQYHNFGAEDKNYDVIQASDGYIYIGGLGIVYNGDGNPMITKFDSKGNLIFDTAYALPLIGQTAGMIFRMVDDTFDKTLATIGPGIDNLSIYPLYQKTKYTGERLSYKFIKGLESIAPRAFYKSVDNSGYTLVCDSIQKFNYIVKIDTAGNVISKKMIGSFRLTNNCYVYNKNGEIIFILFDYSTFPSTGTLVKYSNYGDSILSKRVPGNGQAGTLIHRGNNEYTLLGFMNYTLDSNLIVMDSVNLFNTLDSVELASLTLSKDGGFIGSGNYYGGPRTQLNPQDFCLYKTYPNGSITPNVQFMRTGISEPLQPHKIEITIYPNPANKTITVITPQTDVSIAISNMYGQIVYHKLYEGSNIDILQLPIGMYMVEVLNNERHKLGSQKLTIIHEE